jgi:hypothetical protein
MKAGFPSLLALERIIVNFGPFLASGHIHKTFMSNYKFFLNFKMYETEAITHK